MAECSTELKRMVPLYKVVMAAIADSFEDIGKTQQRYTHWAARKLKQLNRQTLKTGKRSVILTVNRNTNTATLPADFDEEIGLYVIVNGKKVALKLRPELVDSKNIEEIACDDSRCPKCNQETSICDEMTITEDTTLVIVRDSTYEQTVIKKLYPDGSYYLETRIPIWDEQEDMVTYINQKEFIAAISLKPCGCIDDTEDNIAVIKSCCYDVYCNYYAPCDTSCQVNYGGYKVFPETGLIQFDAIGSFKKVYMEYRGFMPKKNGQYQVPEVAFETIVKWVQFMNVDGRYNVPNVEKRWRLDRYEIERKAMEKEMGRISLSQIIQAIGLIPKFDIEDILCDPIVSDASAFNGVSLNTGSSSSGSTSGGDSDTGSEDDCGTPAVCPPSGGKIFTPFDIAVVAGTGSGRPIPGINTYQNDKLKNSLGVNMIIVNNTNETIKNNQFTLDTITGTITRYQADGVTPNDWQDGDILIVPTFFKLV